MKIFIIILHYGKLETTQKCIASIVAKEKNFKRIIIVNNDKNISLTEEIFKTSHKLYIINSNNNLGFAKGVNIGIRYALQQKADAILLLNNDTILDKAILPQLVSILQREKYAGIAGPVLELYRDQKKIYDLGGKVNQLFGRTSHNEVKEITDTKPRVVTYVSGCCMLIKKELFEKVGYFDEKFFLYYEDVDFCLRAKKAGFLSYILPSVVLFHELSKTAGKVSPIALYHQTKSGVLFGKKYCKVRIFNLAFLFAQSCLGFLKNRKAGIAAFSGLLDGIKQ